MERQHQQPFLPLPFMFPQWQQGQPQIDNEAPARVRLALELLTSLTTKTMDRGMINDVGFDTIQGQKLTHEEEEIRRQACSMLKLYFQGKLTPDFWENLRATTHIRSLLDMSGSSIINCPVCTPNLDATCPLCKGKGKIVAVPTMDV